jgi:uncharacterized membrane protein
VTEALRDLLFGGNTVVRGGILVLLVGVTLLARWAAENSLFPIEARLGLAALIGLGLTGVGFKLRTTRPGFGTTLQGGGLAALYVVSFIAFRLFELVPVGLAFGLFVVIAAAGGALAVLQRSLPLIVIASLGGFAAPILASTGSGNHVALFSYYLVLNASIASIAFVRSWRVLNLLGFVCTYGVASAWGVLSYDPDELATTLPFVFAFMLLFTGEALLFAWRQPPRLKGMVDGTLVFGTPLVSLLALARVLSDVEMGLAVATSAMALFYAGVAVWLWRSAPETLRELAEAFVALGIGLATMAVPFAFEDSPTTAIIWALEGAGVHWVGVRQSRRLARAAGLALQPVAAGAFLMWLVLGHGTPATLWLVNGRFLSTLALAFAGFAIAREADRGDPDRGSAFWVVAQSAGVWGLGWWLYGTVTELDLFMRDDFVTAAIIAVFGLTGFALQAAAGRFAWPTGRLVALLLLPVTAWGLLASLEVERSVLAGGGWLAWPLCLCALYLMVRAVEGERPPWTPRAHAVWLWLTAAFCSAAFFGLADHTLSLGLDWRVASVVLGFAAVAAAALEAVDRGFDAFGRFPRDQILLGAGPVLFVGLGWAVVSHFAGEGETRPLPYLPILNPLDIVVGFLVVTAVRWWRSLFWIDAEDLLADQRPAIAVAAVVFVFGWLNAILVRSVVQWADIPHRAEPLWESTPLQVCLSIAWTLVGFAGMWLSTRRQLRKAWMAFAGLLGITVIKLFVVDLSQLTTPAKIGTFLVVGVLLLIVGYLSPVPPDSNGGAGATSGGNGDGSGDGEGEGRRGGTAQNGSAPGGTVANEAPAPMPRASSSLAWWLVLVPLAGQLATGPAWAKDETPEPLRLEDFAWSRVIRSRNTDVVQVFDVPWEVYRDSIEPGLADVRVFDADGRSVPHAIARPERAKAEAPTLTPLPLYRLPAGASAQEVIGPDSVYQVHVGHRAGRTTVELQSGADDTTSHPAPIAYLVDTSEVHGGIVGLEFELAPTDHDYLTELRVDATEDLVRYRPLRRKAVVAQLAGTSGSISHRRVSLGRVSAKYLRVTWPASEDAPMIVGISAVQQPPVPERPRRTRRLQGDTRAPGSYTFDAGGFVPVDRLQVDLGSSRALVSARVLRATREDGPWDLVFDGFLYQLDRRGDDGGDARGEAGRNPPIEIDARRTRFYRVDFDSKGGGTTRPAPALEIGWPTEQLYFIDQGRAPYVLAIGKLGAPDTRFDASKLFSIAGERARGSRPVAATATLGARVAQRGDAALVAEKAFPLRKLLLWAVLLASVGLVAAMALKLIREMNASPAE